MSDDQSPHEIEVVDESIAWSDFIKTKCKGELTRFKLNHRHAPEFTIDYWEVVKFDDSLAEALHHRPEGTIRIIRSAVRDVAQSLLGKKIATLPEIRIVNLHEREVGVRYIRSSHIGKMVSIRGIMRTVSDVKPELEVGTFVCRACRVVVREAQDSKRGRQLKAPSERCERCGGKVWELLPQNSSYLDSQRVIIQEEPEGLEGDQPKRIECRVYGGLTGSFTVGQRCSINGVLYPVQHNRELIFDVYSLVTGVDYPSDEHMGIVITEEDRDRIRELADSGDVLSRLVASFAPGIYGYQDIKTAVMLQLFGGVAKQRLDGTRLRGDIHVLLVGDPGVAKSQLMEAAIKISPRGLMTSGKSSTSAGLTATAVKDEFSDGRWALEAGALVLADGGFIAVDELDKMSDNDRSSLHEAMEQQSISVSKAGMNTTLMTRCALLGAANPKLGRFSIYEPFIEQIDMPPSLLSRFDLIFALVDKPDAEKDGAISRHIISAHRAFTMGRTDDGHIPLEFMRKYIMYARENCKPVLQDDFEDRVSKYYVETRRKSAGSLTITARQLEAIIRLSEASARSRLSDTVDTMDVELAISLVERFLVSFATDESGKVDIDMITTKVSSVDRGKIGIIFGVMGEIADDYGRVREETLIEKLKERGMNSGEIDKMVSKLISERMIYQPGNGLLKKV